jgi:SpoVK/Ycf46/Vps4 family AAA+-type ATPase
MAKASQIIALLKSHNKGDHPRFYNVAMQIAAEEAKKGHTKVAREIKYLIDAAKEDQSKVKRIGGAIPFIRPKGDLADLLSAKYPDEELSDMVLSEELHEKLARVIKEQLQKDKILSHGLIPRHKLLLTGPPGSGKTMSACALANKLNLPLFTIRLEGVITRFLGDTASKLRQIFDAISETRGVYLFDEFDALGSKRDSNNDVGEIRRVLNSFLQFLEEDMSNSLIIATTNHPELLDRALFRRFDDVIDYKLPDEKMIKKAIEKRLALFDKDYLNWSALMHAAEGLSQSDVIRSCDEAIKKAILSDTNVIDEADLVRELKNRNKAR